MQSKILLQIVTLPVFAGLIACGGTGRAYGQNAPEDAHGVALFSRVDPNPTAHYLVNSDLVLVPVTVTTKNGQAVNGLGADDFRVFEDRIAQDVTHFTAEDAPTTIGLVFDRSGSMESKMSRAKAAVETVLRNEHPGDEFFLIRFATTAELTIGLTNQADQVRQAVEKTETFGSTAILDAMKMAWMQMRGAHNVRKAIILISDGEDNASIITPAEFKKLAGANDATLYTLFIGDPPDRANPRSWNPISGPGLLNDIAQQTGGRMFAVSKLKQLPDIVAKINSWIRTQYVLGYQSHSQTAGFRRIEVQLTKPAGARRLQASWRCGYQAPAPGR